MLVLSIILGLAALTCTIVWVVKRAGRQGIYDDDGMGFGIAALVIWFIWFFVFLGAFKLSPSSQNLTGYIYSSDTAFGYTTAHIRFSEQAGADSQPSFCVSADSPEGKQIAELAGSGKKVRVYVPAYFYFTNNLFACGSSGTTIQEVK